MAAARDALTINEAAATTGWSARMLRYVERIGLVGATRSAAGYRLYGPAELQRLRTCASCSTASRSGSRRSASRCAYAASPS